MEIEKEERFFAITFVEEILDGKGEGLQIHMQAEGYTNLERIALLEMLKVKIIHDETKIEKIPKG